MFSKWHIARNPVELPETELTNVDNESMMKNLPNV
jgi:hypothetical protein